MNPSKAASNLLRVAWVPELFPVDPITIAKKIGLNVLETELPEKVSGALIKEEGKDPILALHHSDSNNRKRFSCAHELGHYISRIETDNEDDGYEYIDLRSWASSNGTDPEEIFANQFAAALLMPEEIVRKKYKELRTHIGMALFFGVSNESMKFRLKNLNLI